MLRSLVFFAQSLVPARERGNGQNHIWLRKVLKGQIGIAQGNALGIQDKKYDKP